MAVVCTGPAVKLTSEFNTKAYFSFNNNKNTRKRKVIMVTADFHQVLAPSHVTL